MNNTGTTTTIQANKTVSGRQLLRATIRRGEDGLKIDLSSPIDWSIFAQKNKGYMKLGGIDCFIPKGDDLAQSIAEVGVRGSFGVGAAFIDLNYPNLTLLLAKDINQGVTFNFGLVPISDSKLELFVTNLREQVKTLYLSYLRPVERTVIINAQTIESTIHE
jgi:hypothetical protein